MIYEHADSSNCRCESLAWHKSVPSRTLCPEACGWVELGGAGAGVGCGGGEVGAAGLTLQPLIWHPTCRRHRWIIINARIWVIGCTNVQRRAEAAVDHQQLIGLTNPLASLSPFYLQWLKMLFGLLQGAAGTTTKASAGGKSRRWLEARLLWDGSVMHSESIYDKKQDRQCLIHACDELPVMGVVVGVCVYVCVWVFAICHNDSVDFTSGSCVSITPRIAQNLNFAIWKHVNFKKPS